MGNHPDKSSNNEGTSSTEQETNITGPIEILKVSRTSARLELQKTCDDLSDARRYLLKNACAQDSFVLRSKASGRQCSAKLGRWGTKLELKQ